MIIRCRLLSAWGGFAAFSFATILVKSDWDLFRLSNQVAKGLPQPRMPFLGKSELLREFFRTGVPCRLFTEGRKTLKTPIREILKNFWNCLRDLLSTNVVSVI